MKRYIIRRLLLGVVVVWLVSVIIFLATRIGPDPVLMIAHPNASEKELQEIRKRFDLDKALPIQYLTFVLRALKGDLGDSLYFGMPVSELILKRLPASLELVIAAEILALIIGLLAGVLAARSQGGWTDNLIRMFSLCGLSVPNFWIGMLAILIFSIRLEVLPTGGRGGILHLLMPAFSLGWSFSAGYTRLTHSSLLEVLNSEYIKLVRIKGLPEMYVLGKHALKNALIPVVTLAGIDVVIMISSAVAIEVVFAWPGLGSLLYDAATNRDFNAVQGVVILVSGMMVMVNLLVDILYAYMDPRIRYK